MVRRGVGICSSVLVLCVAVVATAGLPEALAQDYPTRSIRLLVGFPAGGPSDVPARIIAEKMQAALGQPVVVENKTGAAGMIALNEMLAQPRDGYTLLLCSYLDASNTLLYKKVAYKLDDIAPIGLVSKAYYAFTVPTSLPVNSMPEFIAYAKERPGQLNYGKVGAGSVTELLARQLEKVAGISMVGVPFKGTGPALQEVIAGRLELAVSPLALALPQYEGGQVKLLGLTSPARLAVAPKVPTLVEQQVPIASYGWWGMCAASGTPQPLIDKINSVVTAAVNSSDYKSVMEKGGTVAVTSTPEQLGGIITETVKDFDHLITTLGIKQLE
ncbi:MAG TPA: tripartite tricarboxylate transporter substrate binding protein [Hyphomicrobiaceae bacterium]|jgi:tripartite-type tricarboxylate transporter receptor subunit TctC|nr:tripartite tricarboxylate transporter substrate binding protein [Hyphomicrobiaceae bacterium]